MTVLLGIALTLWVIAGLIYVGKYIFEHSGFGRAYGAYADAFPVGKE